jgi:hypothetical protein
MNTDAGPDLLRRFGGHRFAGMIALCGLDGAGDA